MGPDCPSLRAGAKSQQSFGRALCEHSSLLPFAVAVSSGAAAQLVGNDRDFTIANAAQSCVQRQKWNLTTKTCRELRSNATVRVM
jgi:hypothetical protein